jgi:cellulose synthase/poly-beta-1,6-N-acetylglucosamine synthase-like glycosyltransferase
VRILWIVFQSVEIVLLFGWLIFAAYFLLLTVAAIRRLPMARGSVSRFRRVGVLIPAHNEELGLEATIKSLVLQRYPRDRFEVIVIADNCRDRTAEIARAAGATVMERTDPELRGKGHALTWAFARLAKPDYPHDAYVILDADSVGTSNLLEVISRLLDEGWRAIQVYNAVRNPGETWISALRFASFASYSYLRPLGRTRLGGTAKLQGNGVCLAAGLLRSHPWRSFALLEDFDYSAELAVAGIRVAFAPEAQVRSEMPLTLKQATSQLRRWERGRWQVIRRHVPCLLQAALRQRQLWQLEAALDLLVPPFSFLIGVPGLLAIARLIRGDMDASLLFLWGGVFTAFLVHLFTALLLVRAPAVVYRALLCAPLYLVWLIWINLGILFGRGEKEWIRTSRTVGRKE